GLRVIPGLCIGSIHEVRSVLLVSRRPLADVRRIALDENSRTSAALVRILAADAWSLDAEFVQSRADVDQMLKSADAALIIGDPALQVDHDRYLVLDLAAEWRKLTGHPFVFALWALRSGVHLGAIGKCFAASLDAGLDDLERIVARAREVSGLEEEVLRRYFTRNLHYRLESDQRAGLEEYFRRAALHGLIEGKRPLRFVD
ncbi:MAG TPA: menaquinone biosynthesis protein, partial [Thermoanaerobaculia bacterium]|nr:menaquinone biosynthesis protein [Thermoanaerobaculia bacterium]